MRYPFLNIYSGIVGISMALATTSCGGRTIDPSTLEADTRPEYRNFVTNHSAKALSTDTLIKEVDTREMVLFLSGKMRFGSYLGAELDAPVFEKKIESFLLDVNPVSVEQFRKFVYATGYKTEAELKGESLVYLPYLGDWRMVKGATWEYPFGKNGARAEDNHPVTHVSFNDAQKYAFWLGKRIPTEFEIEYAANAGRNITTRFAWGNDPAPLGRYRANLSQAENATDSTSRDFYLYTSPIGNYGASVAGVNDLIGNVWEWTSSLLDPYPGSKIDSRGSPSNRVIRGGSFLINPLLNKQFGVWTRQDLPITATRFDVGFRCAASVSK